MAIGDCLGLPTEEKESNYDWRESIESLVFLDSSNECKYSTSQFQLDIVIS